MSQQTDTACTPSPPSPAPGPPSGLTASQNGLESALVSWTAPSGAAAVTGYTIYYQQEGGERSSVSAGASDTSSTISGLIKGATYSITIVASSDTLPSTVTGPQTITIGTHYAHWTTQCVPPTRSVAVVMMCTTVDCVLSSCRSPDDLPLTLHLLPHGW